MKLTRATIEELHFYNGVWEKQPSPGFMLQTRRHSSAHVAVFINYVVVYKNRVTVYIIRDAV